MPKNDLPQRMLAAMEANRDFDEDSNNVACRWCTEQVRWDMKIGDYGPLEHAANCILVEARRAYGPLANG